MSDNLHKRLSVLITTSPVRSNPSTLMIEELIGSFEHCAGLSSCTRVIVCDGCNVADKEKYRDGKVTNGQAIAYGQFCDALEALAETRWCQTTIVRLPERVGFAHAALAGLQRIGTELVTVVQHDYFFVREVDYVPLCDTLMQHDNKVNYITLPGPKHLTVQQDIFSKYGIRCDFTTEFGPRLLPVIYWYDKTHICRTSWYKSFVYEGGSGVTIPRGQFTEHELGVAMRADIVANGFAASHPKYGCYQFDDGAGLPMIEHMNGRRFMTAEQREANGWPADRPIKAVKQKPRNTSELPQPKSCRDSSSSDDEPAERKKFVVSVHGGLANRLRTILGFHLAAKYSDRELLVCWKVSAPCPGHFSDVLVPIKGVEFIAEEDATAMIRQAGSNKTVQDESADGEEEQSASEDGHNGGQDVIVFTGQATVKTILRRFLHTKGARNAGNQRGVGRLADSTLKVDVGRAGEKRIGELYRHVQPLPHISLVVDKFAREEGVSSCVGLHIRRTDHVHMARSSNRFTSDDDFVAKMTSERQADPAARFFLATDNSETQRKFLSLPGFADAVFVFAPIPDAPSDSSADLRHTDLEHAVVDVFLLSRCRVVHGSASSSYSELAWNLKAARALEAAREAEGVGGGGGV